MSVEAIERGGGLLRVMIDDVEVSQHAKAIKAVAKCSQLLTADPTLDGRVYIIRPETRIDVFLVDPPELADVPAIPPAPPVLETPGDLPPDGTDLLDWVRSLGEAPADLEAAYRGSFYAAVGEMIEDAKEEGNNKIVGIDTYDAATGVARREGFHWLGLAVLWKDVTFKLKFWR